MSRMMKAMTEPAATTTKTWAMILVPCQVNCGRVDIFGYCGIAHAKQVMKTTSYRITLVAVAASSKGACPCKPTFTYPRAPAQVDVHITLVCFLLDGHDPALRFLMQIMAGVSGLDMAGLQHFVVCFGWHFAAVMSEGGRYGRGVCWDPDVDCPV